MCKSNYQLIEKENKKPIKAWVHGVPFEDKAQQQLDNIASMDIVHSHIAVMPDVHMGKGATIGSVIPSVNAVIPAAVGVDIGCGMVATRTTIKASRLPDNLSAIRHAFEAAIPHGRTSGRGRVDRGAWGNIPDVVATEWKKLEVRFEQICQKHPTIRKTNVSANNSAFFSDLI